MMRAMVLPATVVLVAVFCMAIRLPLPEVHTPRRVRVAAIQCPSQMGKMWANQQRLKRLITQAARRGAKIVVLPECAVSGYFDPLEDRKWSSNAEPGENELPVSAIAERIPGESTRFFSALAKELSIYVTVPLAEADRGFY